MIPDKDVQWNKIVEGHSRLFDAAEAWINDYEKEFGERPPSYLLSNMVARFLGNMILIARECDDEQNFRTEVVAALNVYMAEYRPAAEGEAVN